MSSMTMQTTPLSLLLLCAITADSQVKTVYLVACGSGRQLKDLVPLASLLQKTLALALLQLIDFCSALWLESYPLNIHEIPRNYGWTSDLSCKRHEHLKPWGK